MMVGAFSYLLKDFLEDLIMGLSHIGKRIGSK
jgi:hypothetical protein